MYEVNKVVNLTTIVTRIFFKHIISLKGNNSFPTVNVNNYSKGETKQKIGLHLFVVVKNGCFIELQFNREKI